MTIQNPDKTLLEKAKMIFDNHGDGLASFDLLGYLLADYFMDWMALAYHNDPEGFTSLTSITIEEKEVN